LGIIILTGRHLPRVASQSEAQSAIMSIAPHFFVNPLQSITRNTNDPGGAFPLADNHT